MLYCAAIALAVWMLIMILLPFFDKSLDTLLSPSSILKHPKEIEQLMAQIVQSINSNKNALHNGALSQTEFEKSKIFLSKNYIELSRRLDSLKQAQDKQTEEPTHEK